jgi:hypothetical protein
MNFLGQEVRNELGVHVSRNEVGMLRNPLEEGDVGRNPFNAKLRQARS